MGKIRCLKCNMVLESKFRHHFVMCSCENQTFIDGGDAYIRAGGVDPNLIEFLDDPVQKPKKRLKAQRS